MNVSPCFTVLIILSLRWREFPLLSTSYDVQSSFDWALLRHHIRTDPDLLGYLLCSSCISPDFRGTRPHGDICHRFATQFRACDTHLWCIQTWSDSPSTIHDRSLKDLYNSAIECLAVVLKWRTRAHHIAFHIPIMGANIQISLLVFVFCASMALPYTNWVLPGSCFS